MCSAIHDTLYRKSHRACRGNAPPSCLRKTALPLKSPTGAFIATQTRTFRKVQSGEDLFPMKIFTAPQHTRFVLPPFHPTKSSLRCMGGIFLFRGKLHFENFMSRPDVIPTFRQRRCTNRGRNFVRSKRWSPYMSSTTSTYFCVLTIRKQLPEMRFERSGRGQESSRGHKFSILENSCHFGTASCWGVPAPNPAETSTANWKFLLLHLRRNKQHDCHKNIQTIQ